MSSAPLHLNIDNWLDKLELGIYKSLFKDYNGVEDLLWMTERNLKDIGINNGSHRARLSTSIAILKDKYEKTTRGKHNTSLDESFLTIRKSNNSTNISPVSPKNFDIHHTGVRSWPSTKPPTAFSTKLTSPKSLDYDGIETTKEELKRALERELSLDGTDLRSYAWYHGTILRQRAEELMSNDGDFIVRDCISQPGDFVITCRWKEVPLHFIIKKIILQPDTIYERIQYCFEKESFDSITDFITYYVGSKCPLSESSGAVISNPINRCMPLSYYSSRYGVQCQIHYVAKALEKIPSEDMNMSSPISEDIVNGNSEFLQDHDGNFIVQELNPNKFPRLMRIGSDPMLSPNTERRTLEPRPNSGLFDSKTVGEICTKAEDKPPPKPSRVPSRKYMQKPKLLIKQRRQLSEESDLESPLAGMPVPGLSLAHQIFNRQISETRFSFLDHPSFSSESSTPESPFPVKFFTMPDLRGYSSFRPQEFRTCLLDMQNKPLEKIVLEKVRHMILETPSKILACHLTKVDLEMAKHHKENNLGLGVTSGLELIFLPQGEQLQKDLLERTECLKLFIAVLILTSPDEKTRVELLNKWIEIAIDTKTCLGNFYGFTAIMLGLTLPEILSLQPTWLALRQQYTEKAFAFETKLRPAFKSLHNAANLEAPNTCFPYILSLLSAIQQHATGMKDLQKQPSNDQSTNENEFNINILANKCSEDFGLGVLFKHLENGRRIMQQVPILQKNGEMSLQSTKYDDVISDMLSSEFHLRLLWGYRGCIVTSTERHNVFKKVIYTLYAKCQEM